MGGDYSKPPFINQYELGSGQGGSSRYYDGWGYKPAGMVPTQKAYTTYFTHGGAAVNYPPASRAIDPFDTYGIVNSTLASFGSTQPYVPNQPGPLLDTSDIGVNGIGQIPGSLQTASNVYPSAGWFSRHKPDVEGTGIEVQASGEWWKQYASEDHTQVGNICNPLNFPYCTMLPIRENRSAVVRLFDGTRVDVMDEWKAAIDRAYHDSYVNGNFDAIDQCNTTDTSASDPCDNPGLLAEIGPFVGAAVLGLLFVRIFAPGLSGSIDQPPLLALTIGTVLSGFYWMRAATSSFGLPAENRQFAGEMMAVPLGWAIVNFVARSRPSFQIGMLGEAAIGGTFGYFVLTPITEAILNEAKIGAFIIGALSWLWGSVQWLLCKLVSGNYDSCTDFKNYPDARRWDAAMIAGKLTDEVRATEGWSREDPRSEFAFKAFMTGPHMHDAARIKTASQSAYEKIPVNPMGSIYAPDDLQQDAARVGHQWTYGGITGWDGDRSGQLDSANINLFSCQNWDLLRYAQQREKTKVGNNQPVEAMQIKSTFDEWVQTVRMAALQPNALEYAGVGGHKGKIKGWSDDTYVPLPDKEVMTTTQCRAFIDNVAAASDAQGRWNLLSEWQETYNPCKDTTLQAWLEANLQVYNAIATNPDLKVADLWNNYYAGIPDPAYRSQLLWWAASGDSPSIQAFWFTDPPEAMVQAAVAAPPPPGLPYGNWYKISKTPALPLRPLACARAVTNFMTNSTPSIRATAYPDCPRKEEGDIGSWILYNNYFYSMWNSVGDAEYIIKWLGALAVWCRDNNYSYSNALWAINKMSDNPVQNQLLNATWAQVPPEVHEPQFAKPPAYP